MLWGHDDLDEMSGLYLATHRATLNFELNST